MTTANKLTFLRIALIPVFLVILYIGFPGAELAALAVFFLASLTDTLDGYVARRYHQVSNLGKFLDPLADKVLVAAALCWFVEIGRMPGWVLAAVLLREFAVSGLRLVAVERGQVIAAAWSGKLKTAATMGCICLLLGISAPPAALEMLNAVCSWVILLTTLYSGVEYFVRNRHVFRAGI